MRLTFKPAASGLAGALFGVGPWPSWVREIGAASGVYVIRDKLSGRVLYVGESHTGRLRKTLLRHFQQWSGKTAGKTYNRGSVEVCVLKVSAGRAVRLQNFLIVELQPRDNSISPAGVLREPAGSDPF
jgi:hypothetical protein